MTLRRLATRVPTRKQRTLDTGPDPITRQLIALLNRQPAAFFTSSEYAEILTALEDPEQQRLLTAHAEKLRTRRAPGTSVPAPPTDRERTEAIAEFRRAHPDARVPGVPELERGEVGGGR